MADDTDQTQHSSSPTEHHDIVVSVRTPTGERVASMETRLDIFLEEQFPAFRESVEQQFTDVKDQIAKISPNGQTPRLIAMGKALGNPEQIQTLAGLVEAHQRREWLSGPFRSLGRNMTAAAFWTLGVGAVAAAGAILHPILHQALPFIP